MTELQCKLFEILKALDTICRKHDIEYFLVGGSALGAIRHNGFIPWDDDIDLGMKRSSWEKFRKIAPSELPDGLILVDEYNYPTYCNHIAKIVDQKSTALYRASLADGCPKGQYIEIFIHDPVPKTHIAEHKRDFLTYCELLTPYMSVFYEKMDFKKGLKDDDLDDLRYYLRVSEGLTDDERLAMIKELDCKTARYSEEESDYIIPGWGETATYYPAENFKGLRTLTFEGMEIDAPIRICDNMRIDYGNTWTYYPPKSDRVAHTTVGNNEISGDVYMSMINAQIDPETTRAMRISQKKRDINALFDRVAFEKDIFGIHMRHAQMTDERTHELRELYDNKEYSKIVSIFDGYVRLKKKIYKYSFDKDIRRDSRELIAASLLMLGRIDDAEAVMDIPRTMRFTECEQGLVKDIVALSRSLTRYYDGLYDEAAEMLNTVRKEFKNSLPYKKMNMRLGLVEGKIDGDINDLIIQYPFDQELIKIKADVLMAQSREAEALEEYRRVIKESDCGMDVLESSKIIKEHD